MRGHFPLEPDAVAGALAAVGRAVDGVVPAPVPRRRAPDGGRRPVVAQDDQPCRAADHLRPRPHLRLPATSGLGRGEERGAAGARTTCARRVDDIRGGGSERCARSWRSRGAAARRGRCGGHADLLVVGRAARRRGRRADARLPLRPVVRPGARRLRAGAGAERRGDPCPPARAAHGLVRRRLARREDDGAARRRRSRRDGVHGRRARRRALLDGAARERGDRGRPGGDRAVPARARRDRPHEPHARRAGRTPTRPRVGRSVSAALVELVRRIAPCAAGLGRREGRHHVERRRRAAASGSGAPWVRGALLPGGVSLVGARRGGRPRVPFVVFPGNVGGPDGLRDAVGRCCRRGGRVTRGRLYRARSDGRADGRARAGGDRRRGRRGSTSTRRAAGAARRAGRRGGRRGGPPPRPGGRASLVVAVRTLEQAESCLLGAEGAVAGALPPGGVVVLTSTVGGARVDGARALAERLGAHGLRAGRRAGQRRGRARRRAATCWRWSAARTRPCRRRAARARRASPATRRCVGEAAGDGQ